MLFRRGCSICLYTMPSFDGRLTDQQVQALVDYLLQSGG